VRRGVWQRYYAVPKRRATYMMVSCGFVVVLKLLRLGSVFQPREACQGRECTSSGFKAGGLLLRRFPQTCSHALTMMWLNRWRWLSESATGTRKHPSYPVGTKRSYEIDTNFSHLMHEFESSILSVQPSLAQQMVVKLVKACLTPIIPHTHRQVV
jgi:hypothetical protein